ncbi:hypothetical protein K5549_015557 [Capra hircus]|nr:hypothetical protein K5549_015557 [Capra hircus]
MASPGPPARSQLLPAASGPRRKRAASEAGAATGRQRVLDEEEYIEGLQTVIQRDFFPDVEKLQAQKEYLEAEENGDLERMRQIAIKFGSALGKASREPPPPYVTPATFETPELHTGPSMVGGKARARGRGLEDGDGEAAEEAAAEPLPSLDVFLSRYTSEDNASFREIMEVAKERGRVRHAWLYQAEEEFEKRQKDSLALPSAEQQAVESSQAGVETWKYKAKNSLMYYPEGERGPGPPRWTGLWASAPQPTARPGPDPTSPRLQHKQGKVGPDGKELIPHESPRVGGFGFVATPSPAPGERRALCWDPVAQGPIRAVPGLSRAVGPGRSDGPDLRRLGPAGPAALQGASCASPELEGQPGLLLPRLPHCSLTPKGLSPAMSPALQRLVSRTASKYTDRALRASYTPSPARASHLKTPASGPQTPTSTPAPGSATRTPLSQDPACITDNLLQLPARRKASDFF